MAKNSFCLTIKYFVFFNFIHFQPHLILPLSTPRMNYGVSIGRRCRVPGGMFPYFCAAKPPSPSFLNCLFVGAKDRSPSPLNGPFSGSPNSFVGGEGAPTADLRVVFVVATE
jgi:hypothetical protein